MKLGGSAGVAAGVAAAAAAAVVTTEAGVDVAAAVAAAAANGDDDADAGVATVAVVDVTVVALVAIDSSPAITRESHSPIPLGRWCCCVGDGDDGGKSLLIAIFKVASLAASNVHRQHCYPKVRSIWKSLIVMRMIMKLQRWYWFVVQTAASKQGRAVESKCGKSQIEHHRDSQRAERKEI
jgi:hypothetical protein